MRATALFLSSALTLCATASFAQSSYNYVVEPLSPTVDAIINSPVEYDENGVMKAQHFNADHLSDEEYQAILDEAARIEAYRNANGLNFESEYVATSNPTYVAPAPVAVQSSSPSYQVELFAPETPASSSGTFATSTYNTASDATRHVVSKGDTLYNISKRYNTTVDALQAENGMSGTQLSIGQEIRIPGVLSQSFNSVALPVYASADSNQGYVSSYVIEPTPERRTRQIETSSSAEKIYAVLPKDTLYKISRFTCVPVEDIIARNGISNPDSLSPGDRLTLPEGNCLSR